MLSEGILPVEEKLSLTSGQKKLEYIMLALRSRGVDFEKYYELFGNSFKTEYNCSVKELLKHGFAKNTERKFYLTDKGYSIADEIIAKLEDKIGGVKEKLEHLTETAIAYFKELKQEARHRQRAQNRIESV